MRVRSASACTVRKKSVLRGWPLCHGLLCVFNARNRPTGIEQKVQKTRLKRCSLAPLNIAQHLHTPLHSYTRRVMPETAHAPVFYGLKPVYGHLAGIVPRTRKV